MDPTVARSWSETITLHHVRPGDLDSLGHLNHANALAFFELGRFDWSARMGLVLDEVLVPVVTRADVRYLKEIHLEEIRISTAICARQHYSVEFRQCLARSLGKLEPSVTAQIWISFLDRRTRRPVKTKSVTCLEALFRPA